jgi:hypothetical protein
MVSVMEAVRSADRYLHPGVFLSAVKIDGCGTDFEFSVYEDSGGVMRKIDDFIEREIIPVINKVESDGNTVIDLTVWMADGQWRSSFRTVKARFNKTEGCACTEKISNSDS